MQNKIKKTAPVIGLSAALFATVFTPDSLESVVKILSDTSQTQFAKNCFIFSLAAAIHAGRVKKEIRLAVEALTHSLTLSIDKVAEAFRDDLKSHSERLDNLSFRVASLESKQADSPNKEDSNAGR